jgi:hypothetical protein
MRFDLRAVDLKSFFLSGIVLQVCCGACLHDPAPLMRNLRVPDVHLRKFLDFLIDSQS